MLVVGHLLLPKSRTIIDTRIVRVIKEIQEDKTVVPMVLAELLLGLNACVRDHKINLHGCITIPPIWLHEHLPAIIMAKGASKVEFNMVRSYVARQPKSEGRVRQVIRGLQQLKPPEIQ